MERLYEFHGDETQFTLFPMDESPLKHLLRADQYQYGNLMFCRSYKNAK